MSCSTIIQKRFIILGRHFASSDFNLQHTVLTNVTLKCDVFRSSRTFHQIIQLKALFRKQTVLPSQADESQRKLKVGHLSRTQVDKIDSEVTSGFLDHRCRLRLKSHPSHLQVGNIFEKEDLNIGRMIFLGNLADLPIGVCGFHVVVFLILKEQVAIGFQCLTTYAYSQMFRQH